MTPLKKTIKRRSEELFRDRSKYRRIVVALHPNGTIGLRLEKCRKEETLPIATVYRLAVQARVEHERETKKKKKSFRVKRGRL